MGMLMTMVLGRHCLVSSSVRFVFWAVRREESSRILSMLTKDASAPLCAIDRYRQ